MPAQNSRFLLSQLWWKKRPNLSLRSRYTVAINLVVRDNVSSELLTFNGLSEYALHRRNIVAFNATICSYISRQKSHRNQKIIRDLPSQTQKD